MPQSESGSSSRVSYAREVMNASSMLAWFRDALAHVGIDFQGVNTAHAAGLVRARALGALPQAANDDEQAPQPSNVTPFPAKPSSLLGEQQKAA